MPETYEYLDCTYTVALAYALAIKFKEPLNDAVRQSSIAVSKRAKYSRVQNLFKGIASEENPAVAFILLSNQVFESGLVTESLHA